MKNSEPIIRSYEPQDETGWLQCRVLAFLETDYFDDVLKKKTRYTVPAIELVADLNGAIIGLLDIECETEPKTVCSPTGEASQGLAGMIWHIAVLPEYQRYGIAQALLNEAKNLALLQKVERFEAWTREDSPINRWYQNHGFRLIEKYYHIFPTQEEMQKTEIIKSKMNDLFPVTAFFHYLGDDKKFLGKFSRVYECRRYDMILGQAVCTGVPINVRVK